jgi:hypothetical protein
LAGIACVLAAAVLVVLVVYLYWLRGFSLLRVGDARDGVLDDDGSTLNAQRFLAWLAGQGAAPSRHVRLIGQIVMPSRRNVRSPVHQLLAEIFEPGPPHFHKSFVRVDLFEHEVKLTCYGVTGEEPVGDVVDTVTVPLTPDDWRW